MFRPSVESMYDRNVVVCGSSNSEAVDQTLKFLGNHGTNIRTMPVERHDVYMF